MQTEPTKAQRAITKTLEKKFGSWTKHESYTSDDLLKIQEDIVHIETMFDIHNTPGSTGS